VSFVPEFVSYTEQRFNLPPLSVVKILEGRGAALHMRVKDVLEDIVTFVIHSFTPSFSSTSRSIRKAFVAIWLTRAGVTPSSTATS
jgi:hypothetical protein